MIQLLKNIFITILAVTVISCNGQVKNENQSLQAEQGSEMVKIPIPENGFSNAYLDKNGSIWFSSNGGGIYRYDGKAFKNYTEKNGFSSNQVFSIVSDHKNNLWFGTQNGLTKYDRKKFEQVPLPYQDTTTGWIRTVLSGSSMYQVHRPVGSGAYLASGFSPPPGRTYSYKQPAAIWSTVGTTQKLFVLTPTTTDISVTRWSSTSPSWSSSAGVLTSAPGSGIAMAQEGSSIGVSSLAFYAYVDTSGTVRYGYTPDAGANFYPSGSSGYSITAPPGGVATIGGSYVTPAIVVWPGGSNVDIFVVGASGSIYTYTL